MKFIQFGVCKPVFICRLPNGTKNKGTMRHRMSFRSLTKSIVLRMSDSCSSGNPTIIVQAGASMLSCITPKPWDDNFMPIVSVKRVSLCRHNFLRYFRRTSFYPYLCAPPSLILQDKLLTTSKEAWGLPRQQLRNSDSNLRLLALFVTDSCSFTSFSSFGTVFFEP